MKLLIAALAAAGLTGCVGYVPYYGDAYPGYGAAPLSPAYGAAQVYPAYPYGYGYGYGYPYYGPSISFGAVFGGGHYHGHRRDWDDRRGHRGDRRWH